LIQWFFWSIAAVWLVILVYNLISVVRAPMVPRTGDSDFERSPLDFQPGKAPSVSILVPARNEAGRVLDRAVRSMLAQAYPDFEVVAVDDMSTDATLEILNRIAENRPGLKVIRGVATPNDWMGKQWALCQARQASRGEWLLATDADVIFERGALREAMSVAIREGLDALSLLPTFTNKGFWMNVVMPVAECSILLLYPYWRVNNARSSAALGAGGFFLIRAAAFDRAGGYPAIRREIIDDVATARLLKGAGFRLNISAAPTLLATPMYSGLRELFHGFGKNVFAGVGHSVSKALFLSLVNLCFTLTPILGVGFELALLAAGHREAGSLMWAPLAAWLTMSAAFAPFYLKSRVSAGYALLAFLGHAVMISILISSAWRIVTGRGVTWKSRNLYAPASEQAPEHD